MLDALDALGDEFSEPEQLAIQRYLQQAAARLRLTRPIWTVAADRPHSGWADRTAVQSAHLRR
jgi:hypothetical protein